MREKSSYIIYIYMYIYIYTIYILYTIYIYIYYIYTIYIYILNPKDTKDWLKEFPTDLRSERVAVPCRRPHATGARAESWSSTPSQAEPRDLEDLSPRPVATEPPGDSSPGTRKSWEIPCKSNFEWTDSERSSFENGRIDFFGISNNNAISWNNNKE